MVMTVEERKCSDRARLIRVSIECVSDDVASSRITILFTPERVELRTLSVTFTPTFHPSTPLSMRYRNETH